MNEIRTVWDAVDLWVRFSIVALAWAVPVQMTFIVVYGWRRPWRDSFVGRALMLKSTAFGVALALTLINTFWTYPFEEQVNAVLLALIAASVTYQLAALLRTPRHR